MGTGRKKAYSVRESLVKGGVAAKSILFFRFDLVFKIQSDSAAILHVEVS